MGGCYWAALFLAGVVNAQQLEIKIHLGEPIDKNSVDFRSANSKTSQMLSLLYPNCLVLAGRLTASTLRVADVSSRGESIARRGPLGPEWRIGSAFQRRQQFFTLSVFN
jgi:hypothetical protein